jgi:hypothetical protein
MEITTQSGVVAGGENDLHPLPTRQGCGQERRFLIDPLPGGVSDQFGEPPAPLEIRKGKRLLAPTLSRLEKHLARPIDAELSDIRP